MKVAVIGGAGYVGLAVCRELSRRGHEVVAVTRANGRFLLEGSGAKVIAPGEVGTLQGSDVVLNLAYPNRGPAFEYPDRNREILEMVRVLAGADGRVVHTSTQAVFGFDFEAHVHAAPVRMRREFAYIEAKIELENLLLAAFAGRSLQIVRLGNVWGPASPTWTAALADKLAFGDPVGVHGRDGYCNATDVGNVADYLAFLIEHPSSPAGAAFHHLAELGAVRWSWWVERMARRLGVEPVLVGDRPTYPPSLSAELAATWRRHSPFAIAREWMYGRMAGSVYRSVVRSMPRALHPYLKKTGKGGAMRPLSEQGDPVFLTLMSAGTKFETVVRSPWSPPIGADESWERVERWMDEAGY